jgi:hypothetical protein
VPSGTIPRANMEDESPDIYAILESFLRDSFGSKYDEEGMQDLISRAKTLLRERMEKEIRAEPEPKGITARKPVLASEPDIENKLLESLKASIGKKEDEE